MLLSLEKFFSLLHNDIYIKTIRRFSFFSLPMIPRYQKIIVIVGPTASGKSDLAVRLAKECNGEVVSADSRQVYKGLDIGTGKITKREMAGIPHHLLDCVSPKRQFTVTEYAEKARAAISEIAARGKLPIVCGGTAFYIDALLGAVIPAPVPPNLKLREKLEKETTENLFKKIQKLDPARAEKIDAKNRRRLIRAIEIAVSRTHAEQTPLPERSSVRGTAQTAAGKPKRVLFDTLKIGMMTQKEELRERIQKRLAARMKKGMVAEARKLHDEGLSWRRMDALGLEYRFLTRYLQKKISKTEMLAQLETAIWRYAKRQMTWWKRDKEIKWMKPNEYMKIKTAVADFLAQ
ncbi:MAG: tRNA (adenosine(37)-N6)-dimethylallyltransferase MiaA [Parcubacteria group bacterium]|nr:tRNA (adenosine(37)-N6)-dimethylallyltransferase MiaA [Parcubacteria group bacterium]